MRRHRKIILLCFIISLLSCAKEGVRKPGGEGVPERETREAPGRTINVPQRHASEALVEKGLAEYRAGELDRAMRFFQDAITVDGQNGAAYYYAAQVCLESENSVDAAGFLDKAEILFAEDEVWLAKVQKLRKLMEQ